MGRTRHELSDAAQAAQASVPPVMIDADEFALYVSQIPSLGPVLGRLVSAAGIGLATYASTQAYGGLREDYAAARSTRALALDAAQAPHHHLVGDPRTQRAVTRLWQGEVQERLVSLVANTLMLPGSLLMDANLVASPLMLGGIFPQLVPWGAAAMAPAVVFMAGYGVWVAGKALLDSLEGEQAYGRLANHAFEHPAAIAALMGRTASLRNIDDLLMVCGIAQAVGAIAMYLLGPIWLVPLLGGTLGLALGKYKRAQVAGQWPVTPSIEQALEPGQGAQTCLSRPAMLGRLAELDAGAAALVPLRRRKGHADAVAQWLGSPSPTSTTADGVQALVWGLSERLGAEGLFGTVAQAVANDACFRPLLPRPSAAGYTVGPDDLLRLVRHDPRGKAPERVQPKNDMRRVERLCSIATATFVPVLEHRQLQERALLDVTVLASLKIDDADGSRPMLASAAP